MRAADALEKYSRKEAISLGEYWATLITILQQTNQQEVQWHLAQIMPRIMLTGEQAEAVWHTLQKLYHSSSSAIVQTFSLEALTVLSRMYSIRERLTRDILRSAVCHQKASIRARAKKLLPY